MANKFYTNPILLDTFSSAIDIGTVFFGKSNVAFPVRAIEWRNSGSGTALITDAGGATVFSASGNGSDIVQEMNTIVQGIKIASSGVTAGTIAIYLGIEEGE